MLSLEDFPRLVSMFTEAALDPSRWQEALDALAAALGHRARIIVSLEHCREGFRGLAATDSTWDPAMLRLYGDRFYRHANPWVERGEYPTDPSVVARSGLSRREIERSEFYAEWLKPQELPPDLGLVSMFRQEAGEFRAGWVFYPAKIGCENDSLVGRVFAALAPTVRRAVQVSLGTCGCAASAAKAPGQIGLALLDAQARVMWGDAVFEGALEEGAFGVQDGRLICSTERLTRAVHGEIRAALDGVPGRSRLGRGVHVPSYLLTSDPWLRVLALPLDPAREFRADRAMLGASAVIVMLRMGSGLDMHAALNRVFGLGPRESEVALLRAHGMAADQIAAHLRSRPRTVRNQLVEVHRKLHVQNVSELCQRIFRLRLVVPGAEGDASG